MRLGARLWRSLLAGAIAVVIVTAAARGHATVRRVAERGPPTLVVGGVFTLVSPPIMMVNGLRRRSIRLQACQLGHGVKMLVAGTVLLPAGLVLAPFAADAIPGAWMDGIVDAMQEDYCTRPVTSLMP
ncbi:MAG: hypothetical protein E6J68_02395 [Deltaproteobacteria bacterium]|nr:MAG: hypothetical protein E6J69_17505 [Deltaproteobacteria bacterium]TMA68997.1 MAG: hypothetical protein E6J68_02395 [Deltaproteobacteria bacterium]TMB43779.1 MAG: hypothetical protein E6J55_11830 [Deltaproteobacteria bacterium]